MGMAISAPICAWAGNARERLRDEHGAAVRDHADVPVLGHVLPVSQLPSGIRPIAYVTPLWHGVDLCRSLALGEAELVASVVHIVYLGALMAIGVAAACVTFRRRLVL